MTGSNCCWSDWAAQQIGVLLHHVQRSVHSDCLLAPIEQRRPQRRMAFGRQDQHLLHRGNFRGEFLLLHQPKWSIVECSFLAGNQQILITNEPLRLEPIGLVFVFFFGLILIIQFVAMLFHRFGTLSHILASTELTCCSQKDVNISLFFRYKSFLADGWYFCTFSSRFDAVGRRRIWWRLHR